MGPQLLRSFTVFGSDGHDPATIARRFRDAAHLAEALGFRPGSEPYGFWARMD